MKSKKFWWLIFFGAIVFTAIAISFTVCYNLSPNKKVVLKNDLSLPMKVWIQRERGVVVKSSSPKAQKVFQFMVISAHKLERVSEQDAIWEACSGGECLYFRLTDIKPQG